MSHTVVLGESLLGGRYRVERLLGEGGMGAVYAVRDDSTGRQLALKRLHTSGAHTALFEREYRTLASLRHPGIVEVYEYGVDNDGAFYTMELLEGADLSKCAPMPWREACVCLREAGSILGVLHARQLVHRDLSPRNLWRLPDGRLKLIDFGALSPFGRATELVGTPAFVAPEAMLGKELDQRTDLYALGALGYWLLTSTHAYRASHLSELEHAWLRAPAAPSSLAKHVEGAAHDIPRELDALVLALLRIDPAERPQSTAEVVDQLNALAGSRAEVDASALQGYLDSSAFVGRKRERELFSAGLIGASKARPQALWIGGTEGAGRSRLLAELSTSARLSGATVLSVAAVAESKPYDTVVGLARALLVALPQQARKAAREHAGVLSELMPELASEGASAARPSAPIARAQERAGRQSAFASWLLSVARDDTLVVLVDDLQDADEESQALLATLARADSGARLLVVCAVASDSHLATAPMVRAFGTAAQKSNLSPLSPVELRELLRSVFGEVAYLDRLSARLHAVSLGSPSHCLMLVRHLVTSGTVRYSEGAFILPGELPDELPSTLQASLLSALQSLPMAARQIAHLVSVPCHGCITRVMVHGLTVASCEDTDSALNLLLRERLLSETSDGLRFTHDSVRTTLWEEVQPAERVRVHRRMAELLAGDGEPLNVLRRALHHLRAGEYEAGEALMLAAARHTQAHLNGVRAAGPMYETALVLLREAKRDAIAMAPTLGVLAVASYEGERAYADRYGDLALEVLQDVLRFDLARRLRPYLGGKLALIISLIVAGLAMRRRGLHVQEVASWLMGSAMSLAGLAQTFVDPERARRYIETITPLFCLGKGHAAVMLYDFCWGLSLGLMERQAEGSRLIKVLVDRLRDPRSIAGLPEHHREPLLAGATYAFGMLQSLICDERTLQLADEISEMGPLAALQANQLRAQHYTLRGNRERGAHYGKCVELSAIQLGTAWQVELFTPPRSARIALWTHDAALAKRAMQDLARLAAAEVPVLASYEGFARATYLVLRGKHEEALPFVESSDVSPKQSGWSCHRALLACVYNGLGRHEEAKEVCLSALAHFSHEELELVAIHLNVQTELAAAHAGLSDFDAAERLLAQLLERYADRGPLVLGWIHRARARVAMIRGELDIASDRLSSMESYYRETRIPTLLLLAAELRDELRRNQYPQTRAEAPLSADDAHLLTRIGLIMTSELQEPEHKADTALRLARDITGANRGFVLYASSDALVSQGLAPAAEAVEWAREHLLEVVSQEEQTELVPTGQMLTADNRRFFAGWHHSLCLLWCMDGHVERPVAALVLAAEGGPPALPPSAALRLMGERLAQGARNDRRQDTLAVDRA